MRDTATSINNIPIKTLKRVLQEIEIKEKEVYSMLSAIHPLSRQDRIGLNNACNGFTGIITILQQEKEKTYCSGPFPCTSE